MMKNRRVLSGGAWTNYFEIRLSLAHRCEVQLEVKYSFVSLRIVLAIKGKDNEK